MEYRAGHNTGSPPNHDQSINWLGVDLNRPDEQLSTWISRQYETLDLPDERLAKRCRNLVMTLAKRPQGSINQAHENWAGAKAAYRFLENDRVTPEALQNPISDSTARLCAKYETIIAVQDTTTLSFESAHHAQGLGTVNDSSKARGMFYHPVMVMDLDGLPIGLLDQQQWCRETQVKHKAKDRRKKSFLEKESAKWARGVANANLAHRTILAPNERPYIIHVFDREGDVHEVFELIDQCQDGAVIRCNQNRRITDEQGQIGLARDLVRETPLLGETTIDVPRKPGQKKRKAKLQIRALSATLTPREKKNSPRRQVPLALVELWEAEPPEGCEPIHWLLWTTLPAGDLSEALEVLRIYILRWKIEEFFFVLKQGCRIEKLQFETAERLAKVLALYAPIALRILQCRDLARLRPDVPCTVILSEEEWWVLYLRIHRQPPRKGQAPPTMEQAVLWIGRLGGHLNRKADGMPGSKTLWRGFHDLEILVEGFRLARQ